MFRVRQHSLRKRRAAIAKIAAKLAVGYTLDELLNDITKSTPASFEPSIGLCCHQGTSVCLREVPVRSQLTTQMKSVGEVMSIGRHLWSRLVKLYGHSKLAHTG